MGKSASSVRPGHELTSFRQNWQREDRERRKGFLMPAPWSISDLTRNRLIVHVRSKEVLRMSRTWTAWDVIVQMKDC